MLNQLDGVSVKPPRDLRLACQPVHLSLSLGSAGQPVDDAADYALIRDDWLWSRSLSHATVKNDSETKQLKYVSGSQIRRVRLIEISQDPCRHIQCQRQITVPGPIVVAGSSNLVLNCA